MLWSSDLLNWWWDDLWLRYLDLLGNGYFRLRLLAWYNHLLWTEINYSSHRSQLALRKSLDETWWRNDILTLKSYLLNNWSLWNHFLWKKLLNCLWRNLLSKLLKRILWLNNVLFFLWYYWLWNIFNLTVYYFGLNETFLDLRSLANWSFINNASFYNRHSDNWSSNMFLWERLDYLRRNSRWILINNLLDHSALRELHLWWLRCEFRLWWLGWKLDQWWSMWDLWYWLKLLNHHWLRWHDNRLSWNLLHSQRLLLRNFTSWKVTTF